MMHHHAPNSAADTGAQRTSPLLTHCPETLPQAAYLDPAWFAREQRLIWARHWVHAGRMADLAPSSVRRVAIAGENLILIRDADGGVTAFHNTCRHRGAELCAGDGALGRLITCPYHAWSYDLTGRLISTGFGTPTPDFIRADHGLYPVHVQLWNGLIFLCLADDPPEFAPDLGAAALDNWPMADLVTGHMREVDLACNWKVFWENYNECLHCPGIHPELCDRVPVYAKGIMSAGEAADWTPDAVHAPVLAGAAQSWTPDGAACGPAFPDLTPDQRAAGHTFVTIYPSMFIVAHVDHARTVTLTPTGPQMMRLRAEWLFPAATLAQPGFDATAVASFAATVMAEDAAACEMNQRGLRSGRYRSGRLMPQEFDVHRFHGWVLAQLAGDPP